MTKSHKEPVENTTPTSMPYTVLPENLASSIETGGSKPRVLVICVNWNGKGVLGPTIASLLKCGYRNLRVVIVDNASSDDSLTEAPDQAVICKLDRNVGYGGAINRVLKPLLQQQRPGARFPEYFILLNNDIEVETGAIRHLIRTADATGPGVYGPKVLAFDDPSRLDAAWGRLTWSHVLTHFYGKGASASDDRWNRSRKVELLMGCCLLVHRGVFETVGLFDERFFMYHEEIDLLYRAGQRNFPIYYCPEAEVRHRGAFSTGCRPLQKVFWLRENTVRFIRKHRPGLLQWAYFWGTLLSSLIFNLLALRWSRVDAIYRGVRKGFEG